MLLDENKVPPNVKSTLRSLQRVNKKIEELSAELLNTKVERERLEKELENYCASIAPIRKVPPEILAAIFEEYVADEPTHVRHLLLVCRLWNKIAMDKASLWTDIRLVVDTGNPVLIQNVINYAAACCKRSKRNLLHITLDFKNFPARYEYTREYLAFDSKLDEDWTYNKLLERCEVLVKCVVASMKRWRSLNIVLNRGGGLLLEKIWWLFDSTGAPMLTELLMEKCDIPRFPSNYSKAFSKSPLSTLKIEDRRLLANIARARPPLRTLECRLDSLKNFQHIYSFRDLQRLTLTCESRYSRSRLNKLGTEKLFLPSLEHLSLQGRMHPTVLQLLDTPSVWDLTIRTGFYDECEGLPNISPLQVTWEREHPFGDCLKTKAVIKLRNILEKYDRMQTFTMYKCYLKPFLQLLVEIRERSGGLQDLRSITLVNKIVAPITPKDHEPVVDTWLDVTIGRNLEELLTNLSWDCSEDVVVSSDGSTSLSDDSSIGNELSSDDDLSSDLNSEDESVSGDDVE